VRQSVMLYRFTENKEDLSFAPAFTPLIGALENESTVLLLDRLSPFVPAARVAQEDFFAPDLTDLDKRKSVYYKSEINKIQRLLLFRSPISPLGHLKFVLDVASKPEVKGSFFEATRKAFDSEEIQNLRRTLDPVYTFRNKFIAHLERDIVTKELATTQLKQWVELLLLLRRSRTGVSLLQRYRELIDLKYLRGLTDVENRELATLSPQIDRQNDKFYGPIIDRLNAMVNKNNGGKE
jgi:type III restriction enzyme